MILSDNNSLKALSAHDYLQVHCSLKEWKWEENKAEKEANMEFTVNLFIEEEC